MFKEIAFTILASPDAEFGITKFLSDHNLIIAGLVGAGGFFAVWWIFSRLYV